MKYRLILLAFLFAAWPLPAFAHPHIFVRYDLTIAPAEAGFIKLHFLFKIKAAANPLLTPGAPALDRPQMDRDMLANLAAHPFYIYLDMGGEDIGRQEVKPVLVEGMPDTYAFDITLPDSVGSFGVALYDPTYFDSVWQSGADSVAVKWDKIACTVQTQDVGKTVWGILRTQYVQCAPKNGPRPPPHILKYQPPGDLPPGGNDLMGGRKMVP